VTASIEQPTFESSYVLMIHGVGLSSPNLFGEHLEGRLERLPTRDILIEKIDWHALVDKPDVGLLGLEGTGQLRGLMRGFIGSSARHTGDLSQRAFDCLLLFAAPLFACAMLSARCAVISILTLAVASSLHLLCCGVADGMRSACRSVLIGLLRPVVFLLAASATFWGFATLFILGVCATLWAATFNTAIPVTREPNGELVPYVGFFSPHDPHVLRTSCILIIVLGFVLINSLGVGLLWPLKVFADIVRFMGDQAYHAKLLAHLDRRTESLPITPRDRIIVVGHSLGSTIAVMWLLGSDRLPKDAHVTLITMGSPNARFFASFYRRAFPRIDNLGSELLARYPNFRWLNIYRPFDPIGARVFARSTERLKDLSTQQYRKLLFRAHSGYWDDERVLDAVLDFVKRPINENIAEECPSRGSIEIQGWEEANRAILFSANAVGLRRLAAGLMTAIIVYSQFLYPLFPLASGSDGSALLEERGSESEGWVYRFEDIFAPTDIRGAQPVPNYVVVFTPSNRMPLAFRMHPASVWALDNIRGARQAAHVDRLLVRASASRTAVRVRYLPESPEVFDLPGLRFVSGDRDSLGWWCFGVACCPLLVVVFLVSVWALEIYCGAESRAHGVRGAATS
jgi:Lipase (class 3)